MNRKQTIKLPLCVLYGLLVLALLAACSPIVAPADAPAAADSPAPGKSQETTIETRIVTHALGESEVPLAPQRIVSLGEDWMLADLIMLGVKPIASTVNIAESVSGIDPAALEGIELWTRHELALETLVAANPDLIIGDTFGIESVGYDLLSQIAPVIAIPLSGIKGQYIETAAALGLESNAAAEVAAFEQRVAEAAAALGDTPPTVSIATVYAGAALAAWVDGPTVAVPTALVELGVPLHPGREELPDASPSNGRAWLGLEQIPLFDGDILILLQTSAVEGEDESLAQMQEDPLWALLPAVQRGNVHMIDRLGAPGFTGLEATLDQVLEILNGSN